MFQREVSSMNKRGGVSISWHGRCALFVCLCMLSAFSVAISAQTASSGLVTGQVTDPSGAAVPGATVTLVAAKTSVLLTATTDSDGRYVFSSVEPGDYTVRVSRAGFQTAVVGGLHVEVLKSITANAKLTIGQPSETIEAKAAPRRSCPSPSRQRRNSALRPAAQTPHSIAPRAVRSELSPNEEPIRTMARHTNITTIPT